MFDQSLPPKNIWLRSFYGFNPEEDGYIGCSQEGGRKHVMGKISAGDLMMIYGAGTGDTASAQQLRILGLSSPSATSVTWGAVSRARRGILCTAALAGDHACSGHSGIGWIRL